MTNSKVDMSDISVLICVYRESFEEFDLAVRSVVLQTHPPRQLVIVDDSGDQRYYSQINLLRESLLDKVGVELNYLGNLTNLGLVASLNLGLEKVVCKYVARMDADDVSLPYRFQKQIQLLEAGFDVVGGAITLFDEAANLNDVFYPATRLGILYSLLKNNPIAHPVALIRVEVLRALNGYKNIKYAEDLDLWMRVYMAGYQITNVKNVLLLRRVHSKQISSRYESEQEINAQGLRGSFWESKLSSYKKWLWNE